MSEEIHEEMAEILNESPVENEQTEEATSTSPEQEEQTEAEDVETPEAKIERLEKENAKLQKGFNGMDKRIKKLTKQRYETEAEYKQRLEEANSRLKEYTGEEYQQPQQAEQTQAVPTREELKAELKYEESLAELEKDTEFISQLQELTNTGNNPFVNNPTIGNVARQMGMPANIAKAVIADETICDALNDAENPFLIAQLLGKAQAKHELMSVQEEAPKKKPRNAKKPPAKPSGASGNRVDVKSMTPEQYAQHRRKQKYGV